MKFTLFLTILTLMFLAVCSGPVPNEHETEDCKAKCIMLLDYTPLCGSNGKEYSNESEFNCDKKCGEDITIAHYGKC